MLDLSPAVETILFLIAIPVVQQAIKMYRDRNGKTLSKLANQVVALVLTAGAVALSGGFLGLSVPALPVLVDGDLMASVPAVIAFLGASVAYIGAAWAIISGLYEVVFDRLFTRIGFATADKFIPVG